MSYRAMAQIRLCDVYVGIHIIIIVGKQLQCDLNFFGSSGIFSGKLGKRQNCLFQS